MTSDMQSAQPLPSREKSKDDNKSVLSDIDMETRKKAIHKIEKLLGGKDRFTEKLAAQYMVNLLDFINPQSAAGYRLCAALEEFDIDAENEEGKKFPVKYNPKKNKEGKNNSYYKGELRNKTNGVEPEDWEILKDYFQQQLDDTEDAPAEELYNNLMRLADHLGLDQDEKDILTLIYVCECEMLIDSLMPAVCNDDRSNVAGMISYMIGKPELYEKTRHFLSLKGALVENGFVYYEEEHTYGFLPQLDGSLWVALSDKGNQAEHIISSVLGKEAHTDLEVSDFQHHEDDINRIVDTIAKAVERGDTGINILLYGPPGGGKTEMAKAIAKKLEMRLYSVGEEDESELDGSLSQADSPERYAKRKKKDSASVGTKRITQLKRAQAVLKGKKNAILLFDEIEDLLLKGTDSSKSADTESKIEVNRLLEENPVVTIWTGNDPQKFHDAVRDRFFDAVKVNYPPSEIRKQIWKTQLRLNDVELSEEDVADLARRYMPPPRMIAKACKMAAVTGQGRKAIENSLSASASLRYGYKGAIEDDETVSDTYDPNIMGGASQILEKVEALVQRGLNGKPFTMLLSGTEGSGKTSALRYVGENLVRHTYEIDVESLVAPGGMTPPEARIIQTFNQAADANAFLVFQGIEKLAYDESGSEQAWNNSLAKTFWDAASRYHLPFGATTDNKKALSDGAKAMFTYQFDMKPLLPEQAQSLFARLFGIEAPEGFAAQADLMPDDFQKAKFRYERMDFEGEDKAEFIAGLIEQHKDIRLNGLKSRIGYRPS